MLNSSTVKQEAAAVGFDACGIARADMLNESEFPLRKWIDKGRHAGLAYMERNAEKRQDPRALVEGARTIICLVLGYNPQPEAIAALPTKPRIARYAYANDYHDTIRPMLHALAQRLGIQGKACCDTVPISDKCWASRAGLGYIGRHTLLITPDWGTWANLAELVTTEECDAYDQPLPPSSHPCIGCRRCIDSCPNHAIATDDTPSIDLCRCTAYHTIESHSPTLPTSINTAGYAFGCDICQLACPHNKSPWLKTKPLPADRIDTYRHLPTMTEQQYRAAIKSTAMSRIGYAQWQRNLQAAGVATAVLQQ